MFLNAASDSPRLAYEAYLDRHEADATGSNEAGSGVMGEEEFYSQLAWLDELTMREIEGRISRLDRERMHELQSLLLGGSPEATVPQDHLEFEGAGSKNRGGQISRPAIFRPAGARHRRDLWRQLRREDRSAGD